MKKSSEVTMCRNCGTPIPENAKVCPSCGAKNTKPFYKRVWFIALAVIVVIIIIASVAGGDGGEKFEWSDLELSALLPEPESDVGEIITDSGENLSIYIHKTSEDEYEEYLEECQSSGFTAGSDESEYNYHAFNEEGYELSLWYVDSDEILHIDLSAPLEMGTLQWPESGAASLLPVPESTTGSISWESSDGLFAYVGDTSEEDYAAYVDACSAKGFSVDYNKGDTFYYADHADGYHLSLNYRGNDVMSIRIERKEEAASGSTSEADAPPASESGDTSGTEESGSGAGETGGTADGLRPEFREAMDSYEAFIDEYVAFMNKYAESDGSDPALLTDYASYMSRYADMVADFEAWENEEMNEAEAAYYLEVQTRVSQKLFEVSALL